MSYFKNKKYAQFIREKPCTFCGGGDWNMQLGRWQNTPAHVKAKGMGGANKQELGNLIPACLTNHCHRKFDDQPLIHDDYVELAKKLEEEFNNL